MQERSFQHVLGVGEHTLVKIWEQPKFVTVAIHTCVWTDTYTEREREKHYTAIKNTKDIVLYTY